MAKCQPLGDGAPAGTTDTLAQCCDCALLALLCVWCVLFVQASAVERRPGEVGFLCPAYRSTLATDFNEPEGSLSRPSVKGMSLDV